MAKQYRIDETRGLFDKRACVKATGHDMREAFAGFVEARSPEAIFARVEKLAQDVLAEHGFPRWPITTIPKGADPVVLDARDTMNALHSLRDLIARGDTEWAAAEAFSLGRIVERLRLRLDGFEIEARSGRDITALRRKGGTARAARYPTRHEYTMALKQLADECPGFDRKSLCRELHRRSRDVFGRVISASTIQKYTAKKRKH